jgi:hypothetical protein
MYYADAPKVADVLRNSQYKLKGITLHAQASLLWQPWKALYQVQLHNITTMHLVIHGEQYPPTRRLLQQATALKHLSIVNRFMYTSCSRQLIEQLFLTTAGVTDTPLKLESLILDRLDLHLCGEPLLQAVQFEDLRKLTLDRCEEIGDLLEHLVCLPLSLKELDFCQPNYDCDVTCTLGNFLTSCEGIQRLVLSPGENTGGQLRMRLPPCSLHKHAEILRVLHLEEGCCGSADPLGTPMKA